MIQRMLAIWSLVPLPSLNPACASERFLITYCWRFFIIIFSWVQSLSHVRLCDFRTTTSQASLSITNSRSLHKLISTELVMPSNHLILCCSLLLLSIFSTIKVFSNESAPLISWSKYWSFRFNISPSNEHSGLISFRMDWLDLLAAQGTLKSLLQHHSSKASLVAWKISAALYLFKYYLALPFFGIGAKLTFPVLWPLLNFPNLLKYWIQTFHSIIF